MRGGKARIPRQAIARAARRRLPIRPRRWTPTSAVEDGGDRLDAGKGGAWPATAADSGCGTNRTRTARMMQLYLDCDGVLADFDLGATELLGMPPRQFEKRRGIGAFWREI